MFINSKKQKGIEIPMRPVSSGGTGRRLGLYATEFKQYVRGKDVNLLRVVLDGNHVHDVGALKTYVTYGSISAQTVNAWLYQRGWISPGDRLLFRLEVDNVNHIHTYHFVKHL